MLYNFLRSLKPVSCVEEFKTVLRDRLASYLVTVSKWFQRFQTGHFSLEDNPHDGRPKTATSDKTCGGCVAVDDSEGRMMG